jgi:(p)ppGpp synthase/HD superfamily hydrolase
MNIFEKAYEIAVEAHAGQFRKDGKTPYIHHINEVIKNTREYLVKNHWLVSEEDLLHVLAAAALHDVVEDCPEWPISRVESVLWESVGDGEKTDQFYTLIKVISLLTKKPKGEQDYADYIFNIYNHSWASVVKLADLFHNSSDLGPGNLRDKYSLSIAVLENRFLEG